MGVAFGSSWPLVDVMFDRPQLAGSGPQVLSRRAAALRLRARGPDLAHLGTSEKDGAQQCRLCTTMVPLADTQGPSVQMMKAG